MRRTATLMLLATGALAGCGGAPDFVRDRDATLRLTLDEYRLRPENIRVRAGRVHIVARNDGHLTHNVQIEAFKRVLGEEATVYVRTETAHPGEVVSSTVVLQPGKYRILCTIANHDDLGQYGELQVTRK